MASIFSQSFTSFGTVRLLFQVINQYLRNKSQVCCTSLEILLRLRLLMRHYTMHQKQSGRIRFINDLTVIFGSVCKLPPRRAFFGRKVALTRSYVYSQRRVESVDTALKITFHLLNDKASAGVMKRLKVIRNCESNYIQSPSVHISTLTKFCKLNSGKI